MPELYEDIVCKRTFDIEPYDEPYDVTDGWLKLKRIDYIQIKSKRHNFKARLNNITYPNDWEHKIKLK